MAPKMDLWGGVEGANWTSLIFPLSNVATQNALPFPAFHLFFFNGLIENEWLSLAF